MVYKKQKYEHCLATINTNKLLENRIESNSLEYKQN